MDCIKVIVFIHFGIGYTQYRNPQKCLILTSNNEILKLEVMWKLFQKRLIEEFIRQSNTYTEKSKYKERICYKRLLLILWFCQISNFIFKLTKKYWDNQKNIYMYIIHLVCFLTFFVHCNYSLSVQEKKCVPQIVKWWNSRFFTFIYISVKGFCGLQLN